MEQRAALVWQTLLLNVKGAEFGALFLMTKRQWKHFLEARPVDALIRQMNMEHAELEHKKCLLQCSRVLDEVPQVRGYGEGCSMVLLQAPMNFNLVVALFPLLGLSSVRIWRQREDSPCEEYDKSAPQPQKDIIEFLCFDWGGEQARED